MKTLSIDIETYSSTDLSKCGVYKYAEAQDFQILLFGYSVDSGGVQVISLADGESIPTNILNALTDDAVQKWAFNANFERVCLSRYLSDICKLYNNFVINFIFHLINISEHLNSLNIISAIKSILNQSIDKFIAFNLLQNEL